MKKNPVATVAEKSHAFGEDVDRLTSGEHKDPHSILGLHHYGEDKKVVRLWRPGAAQLYVEVGGVITEAVQIHAEGLFECVVPDDTTALDYRVYHNGGELGHDPYAFSPTIGQLDEYLFGKGVHYQIYEVLGARMVEHQGVSGVAFAVWAPTARRVSIVTDANHWDGRVNPMRCMGSSGIWELFIPGLKEGTTYKYEIKTFGGELKVKADPYGRYSELRPNSASVIVDVDRHQWRDQRWMAAREQEKDAPKPMVIYEVHLGSWKLENGEFLNYRALAHQLAEYCHYMGYTHVELLPVSEHPLDESWGYQVSGYYAVTSRFGSPEDFQYLVDHLHQNNIGVLVDWVPAHFPTDDFSIGHFDGSCLYEHFDRRQGWHPHWNTHIFNYGRHEVANFLIGSALYWCEKMHIDGLRVDAVASMLYLDYGREEGEWIPNQFGGRENLEAIEFIKHLNSIVHERFPGVLTIAEESTSFQGVSHSLEEGGLGFDLKWNMGWMNDTLKYFGKDSIYRKHHHQDLTFGLLYAYSERFALVLSHDEVVHEKKSLLSKMPGDEWQKFANLRLLYSYMMCQPGKKLLFMGGDFGQWDEWDCKQQIHWHLLDCPAHRSYHDMVRDLNAFYCAHPALWELDGDHRGFDWVDFGDIQNCVISYCRKANAQEIICVHNFTPNYYSHYVIRAGSVHQVKELFNSDAERYGGSGKVNHSVAIVAQEGFTVQLAPLATMIFEVK